MIEAIKEYLLNLEPSPEADVAFGRYVMGWDIEECNLGFTRYSKGPFQGKLTGDFTPTSGNEGLGTPDHWMMGLSLIGEENPLLLGLNDDGYQVTLYSSLSNSPPVRVIGRGEHETSVGIATVRAYTEAFIK